MPYGSLNHERIQMTVCSNSSNWSNEYISHLRTFVDKEESRTGNNHSGTYNANREYLSMLRFTKDGKSIRVLLGTQVVPVRRYRWVGSGRNRQRQFYITYIEKRIWQDVPRAEYSYRLSPGSFEGKYRLLKPNNLTYKARQEDFQNYSTCRGRGSNLDPQRNYVCEAFGGFYAGNMDQSAWNASSSTFNSGKLPFTNVDWTPSPYEISLLAEPCLRELYEKVASRFPDVGTMIGESKETVGMIRNLLNKGVGLIKDLLLKDKKRLLGRLKTIDPQAISRAWLTYVYGITPLISDYNSLMEFASETGIRTYTVSKTSANPLTPYQVDVGMSSFVDNFRYDLTVKYGVIMSADLKNDQIQGALNITNNLGVGYNLIPFSFMVDWLYDIGSYLNNRTALQYGYLHGWRTITWHKHWISFQSPRGAPVNGYSYANPGFYTGQQKREVFCQRVYLPLSDFPSLPAPKFSWEVSSIRGLNAVAILVANHKAFAGLKP